MVYYYYVTITWKFKNSKISNKSLNSRSTTSTTLRAVYVPPYTDSCILRYYFGLHLFLVDRKTGHQKWVEPQSVLPQI